MKMTRKRWMWLAVGCVIAFLLILAIKPAPIPVETSGAVRGPLQVVVEEEGQVQAHDRFVVASPVAGRLKRVELHDGDDVVEQQVLAEIFPLPLSLREKEELEGKLQVARALKSQADELEARARAGHDLAAREKQRLEKLVRDGYTSAQALDQAATAEAAASRELEAARFKQQAASFEVEIARSALMGSGKNGGNSVLLRSPIAGKVLRVLEKSQRVVPAGTPILTLGDATRLEAVIDVLSTDAVRIKPGAPVFLKDWGGPRPLKARVRTVEASAFTKVSALGIEEQRVNVIVDFVDSPGTLGDGYRVVADIVLWESEDVLKIPAAALFRDNQEWAVFTMVNGRARKQIVRVGQRNPSEAEILEGIEVGNRVLLHPSNRIQDGIPVTEEH